MANNNQELHRIITFHLFAEPSFLEGAARLVDFNGTLNVYNESSTAGEADYIALRNDWLVIGQDFKEALSNYEREREAAYSTK